MSNLAGSLMKVSVPLAKKILAPLEITAATSAIDARNENKKGSGCLSDFASQTTTLAISNKEINDVKLFNLLQITPYWKELLKQLKMKQKNKKEHFRNVFR